MSSSQALRLRALARAVELSGGPEQLATYLRISAFKLGFLLQGKSIVSEELFLRVVDLLIQDNLSQLIAAGSKHRRLPLQR